MEYLNDQVIAILVPKTLDGLIDKVKQLISDNYRIFEVTLRTDCALDAIKLLKDNFPTVIVGAGTILSIEQLKECISQGADFGVAPGLNKDIVEYAQSRNFDFVPGIATATELEQAMSLGLKLVKVFPAKYCGGAEFIKTLSGPYNQMEFMPTGGITKDTSLEYLNIPAVKCVGGSWMSKS